MDDIRKKLEQIQILPDKESTKKEPGDITIVLPTQPLPQEQEDAGIQLPKAEEETSVDALLQDQELNDLLSQPEEEPVPLDPKVMEEKKMKNIANDNQRKKKEDKALVALMATASVLCLGIIGVLAYWLTVLL